MRANPVARSRPDVSRQSQPAVARPVGAGGLSWRRVAAVVVVAMVAVTAVPSVGVSEAADADRQWLTDAERDTSTQRRQQRQELLGELDVLRATDVELQAEADRLDADIAELAARTEAAADELVGAQQRIVELEAEVAEARAEFDARQELAARRAVLAYMQPPMDTVALVLGANDLTEAERRRTLANNVAANDRMVMAERQQAADALERLEAEVAASVAGLRIRLADQEADLEGLRTARARSTEVAAALETRISAFQAEADALAASEADLVSLITQRQAAAATTTTTAAPTTTTTTAPTAPVDDPGSGGGGTTVAPTTPPTTTPTPVVGGSLLWPTSGVLTSPYGWRWGTMHQGIDIGAPSGTPIYAAAGGTVFFSGWMGGYGNLILIDHGDGRVTAYAHQSSLAVSGGPVGRGQLIGYVGSTGDSTGPHLHFEVRVNGSAVDPMRYLR
jgi:murein DD-endopeptidase MepM/ murein hydrolase activator NlpD